MLLYTLSFNPNGGSCTTTSVKFITGKPLGELPTAVPPAGTEFDGWHDKPTGGTKYTSISLMPESDLVLYAHYSSIITSRNDDLCYGTWGYSPLSESNYSSYNYTYSWNLNRTHTINSVSFHNQTLAENNPSMVAGSWLQSSRHYTATVTVYVDNIAITSGNATPGSDTYIKLSDGIQGKLVTIKFSRNTEWHSGDQYYSNKGRWVYSGEWNCYVSNLILDVN